MCITIAVSQIFKLFHAIKFDGQLHGLALRKLDKSVLVRSSMLSCMGLLGVHPLEPQYKVTVGNVAWTDFLNFFQG